ncbi:uncharacterized protein LOC110690091 [Chenopodium quinoa]|uniref:uncharacterized protein LOC110690091 n=1 Tax=Chenopodium quinoa TaxID=63459 RepID=UPI000B793FE1|nr:uncharacterized protein LOC110690091 [Chenopodium quinoa]
MLRTVKKGVNMRRKLYGCPFWPDIQCAMFRWISDINDGEDVQYQILERDTTIAELEHEKKMLEVKIKKLQVKKENLEEDLQEFKTELGQIRIELLRCSRNEKSFSMALLFSWIFFVFLLFNLK